MRHHQALGRMLALAGELARKEGATDGFRSIINTGRVGHQEVYHVHMHVPGRTRAAGDRCSRGKP
jgi:histidine triad (HIT) family protein